LRLSLAVHTHTHKQIGFWSYQQLVYSVEGDMRRETLRLTIEKCLNKNAALSNGSVVIEMLHRIRLIDAFVNQRIFQRYYF
jgi:hypothetical protein